MSEKESWENICCRCGSDVKENRYPGRRACHLTCGPCLYPDNPKCNSCEVVGHCRLALDFFRSLNANEKEKGYYFGGQLNGEETLYHTLAFTDGQQRLVNELGAEQYMVELKKTSSDISASSPRFLPRMPKDTNLEWTRITLTKPINKEWIEVISKVLKVNATMEDSLHIVVRGEKERVRKTVEMLYQLQMVFQLQAK